MALATTAHERSAVQGALLYNAVGLEPFMDVIWTTADQPGNIANQGKLARRTNIELQAIVAALASGPVGIGDGPVSTSRNSTVGRSRGYLALLALEALALLFQESCMFLIFVLVVRLQGYTNATLAKMFCAADGTLLHPSAAATPIDRMFHPSLKPKGSAAAEVWSAPSVIPGSGNGSDWWTVL